MNFEKSDLEKNVEKKEKKPTFDAAIVFGFYLPPETEFEKKWNLNYALCLRLDACAALYKTEREKMEKIFVSEGRTKGEGPTAEDMKNYLVNYWGIPENKIEIENQATNTIENFAYIINEIDQEKEKPENLKKYANIALISNGFHTERIKQLAKLFEFQGQTISAEEMIKHAVRSDKSDKPELEDFKEKTIEHAEFEPEKNEKGEETGKKVWKPTEHNPKKTGYNLGEMKSRAFDTNRPDFGPGNKNYREWLEEENKWMLPLLKHGWENYFLQNIAIINPDRLQRIIANNKNIQKFIAEFAKDKIKTASNLKQDDQKKLKTVQQELNDFLQEKNIDPENQNFSKQITNLEKPDMEKLQKLLLNINRLSSTISKTEKKQIDQEWNNHFEDTNQQKKNTK